MEKPELLLPAGNIDCLRAAVANRADAVYLGIDRFNARAGAGNFRIEDLRKITQFCHDRGVRVYCTFNTLVKNDELKDFFMLMGRAIDSGIDAVIIQDPCVILTIRRLWPKIAIHLSTQAAVMNSSIPEGADRVIAAREMDIAGITALASRTDTEVFVHGALCLCYSGLCLMSSIAGGRSGNRGRCAQPCRKIYNSKYSLSTKDLCLINRIPELIDAGVKSFKVEGRMRSPYYVATVAEIYRKAIDSAMVGSQFTLTEDDSDRLSIAFNREFTEGFAYEGSITDSRMSTQRGLYLGMFNSEDILLKKAIKVGDEVLIYAKSTGTPGEEKRQKHRIGNIYIEGAKKDSAVPGSKIKIDAELEDGDKLFLLPDLKSVSLGDELEIGKNPEDDNPENDDSADEMKNIDSVKDIDLKLPMPKNDPLDSRSRKSKEFEIYAFCNRGTDAVSLAKAGADIIYYDIRKEDFEQVSKESGCRVYAWTPRIADDNEIEIIIDLIRRYEPQGALLGNRGLYNEVISQKIFPEDRLKEAIHLDYSMNAFNDIDMACLSGIPIISPELNLKELSQFRDRRFSCLIHGRIIVMTTKEDFKAPELVDDKSRHFRIRDRGSYREILNSSEIGLFNRVLELKDAGIRRFVIDTNKEPDKFVRIYRKILTGKDFDDSRIRKGYTTGHLERGVE